MTVFIEVPMSMSVPIPMVLMAGVLSTALEGGSNYWIADVRYSGPRAGELKDALRHHAPELAEEHWPTYAVLPLVEGFLRIRAVEETEWRILDASTLRRGVTLLRDRWRARFQNTFVNEDYDADDADTFLQLCLFGEVVYG